jgi:hypothetical protein
MSKFSLAIVIGFVCACTPTSRPGIKEISKAPPASKDAQYNLDLPIWGISLTLPNGRWVSEWLQTPPSLMLSRPGRSLQVRIQICNKLEVKALEDMLKQQRNLIVQGRAGSDVRVDTLMDEHEGRRSFEILKPGPNHTTRMVKMIFAPMPGRIDQLIAIFVIGEKDDYAYMKIAVRYIVESIRPLGATSAIITAPGTDPDD